MTTGSVGKLRRFLTRVFRERQIYHRSDGVVHFISMSAQTQIALFLVTAGFLLWVAYATVNVIFKEQIIVNNERQRQVMETMLQARIAASQRAYDEVSTLNIIQRDQFDEAMRDLNGRHRALESVFAQERAISERLDTVAAGLREAATQSSLKNGNRVMISPAGREPSPRQSRTPKLRQSSAVDSNVRFAGLGFSKRDADTASAYFTEQAGALRQKQINLLTTLEESATLKLEKLEAIIEETGVPASKILAKSKIEADDFAQGGPLIEVADAERLLLLDEENPVDADHEIFFRHTYRLAASLDQLDEVERTVATMPLAMPLKVYRRLSSPFGMRTDPFTKRRAFHGGTDFSANWGAPINTTAPGIVVYSGRRTGFGLMVEVDHGNGFRTRYAHMSRTKAKKGDKLALHDVVGLVGSSGRSTGPHLHYEVLFNGKRLDPESFFEAGRYVFESKV